MADPVITFDDDIVPILKPYRNPMLKIGIATPDGVFQLDLTDFESVKQMNERITIAIHGYEAGRESAHPMPPDGPLDPADITTWDNWVAGGMVKSKPLAV